MKIDLYDKLVLECKGKKSEQILDMALDLIPDNDIESITYLYEILKTRKRQKFANQLARELDKVGLEPVSFLLDARKIAKSIQKTTKGTHHVYVVLLDGYLKNRYGLYVGESSRKPENRFKVHKEGGELSAKCHKKMTMLLPSLFEHLNPLSRKEGKLIEEQLADAYREFGIKCDGGVKKKVQNEEIL
jgi:hypothetical protein